MDVSTMRNARRKRVLDAWLKGYEAASTHDVMRGDIWSTDHALMSAAQEGFDTRRVEMRSVHQRAFAYAEEIVPD